MNVVELHAHRLAMLHAMKTCLDRADAEKRDLTEEEAGAYQRISKWHDLVREQINIQEAFR